jgi:hypothetical protein
VDVEGSVYYEDKKDQRKARGVIPEGTDIDLCVRPSVVLSPGSHERTVGLSVDQAARMRVRPNLK